MDVDPITLQTKKFENIWGIGDIVNLPLTKSYWAAFHQMHVVRNNVVRALKGLPPNAPYSGYTKAPFYLGASKATYIERDYKGPKFWNLVGAKNSFMAARIFGHVQGFGKKQQKVNLGKNFGPPYGRFMPFGKRYKGTPITRKEIVEYVPAPKA